MMGADFRRQVRERRVDMRLQRLFSALDPGEFERTQTRCDTLSHLAVLDHGKLHGRAADVAHEPVRIGPAEQNSLR